MNVLRKTLLNKKIEEAKKYFLTEKYSTCISLAENHLVQGNLKACNDVLNRLPTKDTLLESLVSKLKGKSVYKTLEQIHDSKADGLTKAKGISSLITHCIIEMQNGNKEYSMLLPVLLEKEVELINNLK